MYCHDVSFDPVSVVTGLTASSHIAQIAGLALLLLASSEYKLHVESLDGAVSHRTSYPEFKCAAAGNVEGGLESFERLFALQGRSLYHLIQYAAAVQTPSNQAVSTPITTHTIVRHR